MGNLVGLVDQGLQPRSQGRQIQPGLVYGLLQPQVAAAAKADIDLAKDAAAPGSLAAMSAKVVSEESAGPVPELAR
jgi:hypothetical protein